MEGGSFRWKERHQTVFTGKNPCFQGHNVKIPEVLQTNGHGIQAEPGENRTTSTFMGSQAQTSEGHGWSLLQ